MCGIFGIFGNYNFNNKQIMDAFMKAKYRGPEYSVLTDKKTTMVYQLGFHRLAINGLDEGSHQPLTLGNVSLICNGEIYNYKALYNQLEVTPTTHSDCEVILHLYQKYGMETTLQMIDGVFAFILVDEDKNEVYVARDPYGVRPLFMLKNQYGEINYLVFGSELKQIYPFFKEGDHIDQYPPGHSSVYTIGNATYGIPVIHQKTTKYTYFPFMKHFDSSTVLTEINARFRNAVRKRVTTTERPIACLLSGGLDSSLVTSLVASYVPDVSKLETYSIGLSGSVDLKYAQLVADKLGTKHTSIVVEEKDFLAAIPAVLEAIESYDTTTVRASVGNYLVAKHISEHSDAKVIFNGDGSDELTGGYLYFHKCPDSITFDLECKRLLSDIHKYDVLRSDRTISHHGLEARTPFLDREFVEFYLTIPANMRNHNSLKQCEKYLLRKAFDEDDLLPAEVLWRTKEAFSDGVSSSKQAWYELIQDHVESIFTDKKRFSYNTPKTSEQYYYRDMYEKHFKGTANILPYFWMPKFVNATDCSARSLDIYNTLNKIP